MTLHIVSTSPTHTCALRDCLAVADINDEIILIEDGVYALLQNSPRQTCPIWALASDCRLRGLINQIDTQKLVDITYFVELTQRHTNSMTWA